MNTIFNKALRIILVLGLVAGIYGKSIRIHNVTDKDFKNVSIMKQSFGDIPAGATSEYKNVKTILSYAAMKMTIDGTYVTGQTLNMGSKSFTYDIDIIDLEKGWLKIDIIRD